MTDLSPSTPAVAGGWAGRLSWPVRIVLLALTTLALVFCVGVLIGILVAIVEHGYVKPRALAFLIGGSAAAALFAWLAWHLSAHWRRPGRSAYEQRYTKMIMILVASGLPLGLLLGMAGDAQPHDTVFSNGPLDPLLAGIAAATLVIVLAGTLILYHRSIDDHEQQAYLWANSLAFYFLALALPAAWLLARGGLIAPIGIGSAMLILLAAFVINFTVWAWLKFR